MLWEEHLKDNDGREEEAINSHCSHSHGNNSLKVKNINLKIAERQWMLETCVFMLPLFPFTSKTEVNDP